MEANKKTDYQRIKEVLDYLKISARAFSISLNLKSPQIFYDIKANKCGISKDLADKIQDKFFINKVWLLTGEGEMLKGESKIAEREKSDNEYKPIVPLNLYQETNVNLNDYMRRHRSQLSFSHTVYSISNYDCVYTVITEAMIPNIKAGDRLALKRMEHGATIINGVVYVLDTISNGMLLRLLYDEPSEPDNYICRAFNERYTEIRIKKNDVFDVYKVVGLLRASII